MYFRDEKGTRPPGLQDEMIRHEESIALQQCLQIDVKTPSTNTMFRIEETTVQGNC